ncbi:MAG: ATP-grasp domain-containing protein [Lacunisphaera sp.]
MAGKIGLVGVLGVEYFVTKAGEVLINELAPRTHNSGHYTLDACGTSQFEQQARAICGAALGPVVLTSPVVMVNLLGDIWRQGEPRWEILSAYPPARLHLYGKAEARAGRKMGHLTVLASDVDGALALAKQLKAQLRGRAVSRRLTVWDGLLYDNARGAEFSARTGLNGSASLSAAAGWHRSVPLEREEEARFDRLAYSLSIQNEQLG